MPVTFENCETGKTVSRGKDWMFGDQDQQNGIAGTGVITECQSSKWARVQWNNGNSYIYHIGGVDSFIIYSGNNKSPNA